MVVCFSTSLQGSFSISTQGYRPRNSGHPNCEDSLTLALSAECESSCQSQGVWILRWSQTCNLLPNAILGFGGWGHREWLGYVFHILLLGKEAWFQTLAMQGKPGSGADNYLTSLPDRNQSPGLVPQLTQQFIISALTHSWGFPFLFYTRITLW